MTTFDTSSDLHAPTGGPAHAASAPETATVFTPGEPSAPLDSLLDQLRERVAERDESDPQEWVKEIPKVGIRLVCDPDIEAEDYQRWVKGAQARGRGGRRRALTSALDLDQFALSVRALTATCLRLEIHDGEKWRPMTGARSDVLNLESTELLRTFGVMDSASVLRKLFGRDARIIDAGQELLTEAGYLGGDDDDDNPE